MNIDIDRVTALIERIAAEEIMPRFRNLAEGDIIEKGKGDLVTRADHETERRLTAALRELLPGSEVLGEEAAHAEPEILGRIETAQTLWIIDPLDGTNNFTKGDERFASMVALVVDGETVAGWIHLPMRHVTAIAERGQGAFLDGRRLKTAAPRPVAAMRASVHTGYMPPDMRPHIRAAAQKFLTNDPVYCAGKVYVDIAEGEMDAALYWRTKPWDHAMGTLILSEAGGMQALPEGTPYTPTLSGRNGLIAASGSETWHAMRDLLFPNGL